MRRPIESPRIPKFGKLDAALIALVLTVALAATSADYVSVERMLHLMKTQATSDKHHRAMEERLLRKPPPSWLARQSVRLDRAIEHASAFLVVATIGTGAALFARPSSWQRRSMRGAGVIATVALAPWLALCTLNEFLLRRFPRTGWGYQGTSHIWEEIAEPIGGAVAAVWLLLWIGRSWWPEPSWRDRLGRVLMAAWLGYALVAESLPPLTRG